MRQTSGETIVIPSPDAVRVELARSARETRRLRSLLRLSEQAVHDQRFIDQLKAPKQTAGAA